MRIIAGTYRGRVLATLRGPSVRPTGERLRESLFDVLGDSVRDRVFLDCYAGSGAVGLEALSRGAARVYLIEESAAAQRLISRNLASLGLPPSATLVRASARRGLSRLEAEGVCARYCFLDPPYDSSKERERTLRWLASSQIMEPAGAIIVQHDRKDPPPDSLGPSGAWTRTRILAHSSNALSFYCCGKSDPRESEPRPGGSGFDSVTQG
jgi:16S rRNA (guanine(966)-N(2))-methyltransferase RsmD